MSDLQPWQQRVVDEKTALDEKLKNLDAFVGAEAYFQLRADHRSLLMAQKSVMAQYSNILHNRIELFQRDNDEERQAAAAAKARETGA